MVGGQSADLLTGHRLAGGVVGLRGAWKQFSYDLFAGKPLSRPEGFRTANTTTGFNLSLAL